MAEIATNGVVKLEYSTDDGTTWNNVEGVVSFEPGNFTAQDIDVTDYDSTGNQREYVSGYKEASDGNFVINFEADDASHVALQDAVGGAAIKLRHMYGTKYLVMSALIKSMSYPSSIGEVLRSTVTIKAAAAPTWEAVS